MWANHPDAAAEIGNVTDAQGLWRLLVTGSGGPELPPAVAVEVFGRLHNADRRGSADSALLLCTDWRWRRTSAKVLAGILDTGILDDADQDTLAGVLLWSDTASYEHPLGWIGSTFIEYELNAPNLQRKLRERKVHLDPNTPVTVERHVWPPLRAWATERIFFRSPAAAPDVLARARELPAQDAAAVVKAAVHGVDGLHPQQAREVVEVALAWGHKAARKAALERLIEWGGTDRAHALAANDPDASIRAWDRKLHTDVPVQQSMFD